ncbi:glucosamine-6-phosphate isomerase [Pseudovibrio exalbescens]|uniref:glucosamine-6-phosphate isomerase n=1 Tax=Pseudovibrio exalbescens TaxID=197461 RepID=UPI000C99A2AF|nr:glucosamine-6-phosphate isomerase [Pseudovibrio exalbescens]
MQKAQNGLSRADLSALALTGNELVTKAPFPVSCHDTNDDMISALVALFIRDFETAVKKGRESVSFIMPVGPVGQYPRIARYLSSLEKLPAHLTIVFMDEYLELDNKYIGISNPLSFRGHVKRDFSAHLAEHIRGEVEIVFPDPLNPYATTVLLERVGLDYCYAGVGITGHLAFNDPIDNFVDSDAFADLPTRVVQLAERTRLINCVTAARGNLDLIPHMAVTVGMREILSAGHVRVFMNRDWQCAAVRRMMFGQISPSFPASLLQRHPSVSLDLVKNVLCLPEPELR